MRFGRVEGIVSPVEQDGEFALQLRVWLDTGRKVETVREEILRPLRPVSNFDDLCWHADQWTQETIGTTLAEQGWEAIGAGDLPAMHADDDQAVPRSAPYTVRNVTWS